MTSGIFWLASYPKSGNTWLRSYIFALKSNVQNNSNELDINQLSTGSIASSRAWLAAGSGLELNLHPTSELESYRTETYRYLHNNLSIIAYHKIHDANINMLTGALLCPDDACLGALYVVRNPFDVAISFANHLGFSIDKSIELMAKTDYSLAKKQHKLTSQVKQYMGSWGEHVNSWLDSELPLLWVRYEDMQQDALHCFTTISEFLHLPMDEASVLKALELCHFDKLSAQEKQYGFVEKPIKSKAFFRKGKVGDWTEVLTPQQVDQIINDHYEAMLRLGYIDTNRELTALCFP
ncbi:sulfotransferase domain-containing protein [Shewanella sp. AC91-MNA-CIBAN-0169]|uniref:sulfotransferase domain-containing protein n=1 Tax=Shewanella sp. AC91-MNA-CIBAN-0169 TaxID=3140466 RepID=UPI0033221240